MMNKKEEALDKFNNILYDLKIRRGMYIPDGKYTSLLHFITGYQTALRDMTNVGLSSEFHHWLEKKVNRSFALHWGWYILNIMSKKDETVATQKLLELLEEFIEAKRAELSSTSAEGEGEIGKSA